MTIQIRHSATFLGLAAAAACAVALPARAGEQAAPAQDSASVQADIGALTGFALGAAAAGPVGAVVGTVAGVALGDRYHRQRQDSAALRSDLGRSQARGARLEQTLARVNEVGMDVSFRTNDAAIKAPDLPPLLKLGALAAAMPEMTVRVAGFADPRGAAAYNDALSLRRAETVAAALASAGVPPGRILVEAHGSSESSSPPGDLDAYALDRRVTVRLERSAPVAQAGATLPGPAVAAARGP
jgi:outer membrane protein OmpA-like peptidoglycan-associated protein